MRNAVTKIDFYKADHRRQYPEGTVKVYSNFTPRKSRIDGIDHVIFFGMQYIILAFLIEEWNRTFFNKPVEDILAKYQRRMDNALGKGLIDVDHILALHAIGYLPLEIKALPEGTKAPIGVPVFTVTNTRDEQFWLVNYLETVLSNKIWKMCTSATIAHQYRKVFEEFYAKTVGDPTMNGFVMWQGHDFSYRGMSGDEDACGSGAGHLLSFYGTDTVPAIDFLEDYYFANSDEEIVGGSVPATEHSVMCMGGKEDEIATFRRLITEIYPSGIVSIVSDTWDFWQVITEYLPILKDEIINRTGSPIGMDKVVIRPDSGDPYRIICGYFPEEYTEVNGKFYITEQTAIGSHTDLRRPLTLAEVNGAIQGLWNTFGGSLTPAGFRQLSPKIGLIYGDSITLDRQQQILTGLMRKGFASTNIVMGIGSFTYEYQTRDTFGFAMKATYGEVVEIIDDSLDSYTEKIVGREIFKDPKTDSGMKKSAKGLLQVTENENNELVLKDQCSWEEEKTGLLQTVFLDGKLTRYTTLNEVRTRLNSYL